MSPGRIPERAAGDVLDGRYRLIERLGRGGFGDVWRAEELLPDGAAFRDVALKLLVPDFADAARWTEEAKLLASFRHPSLVTVYAAGMIEGSPRQPFVAMELLIGDTLADVIARRRRIPWRRVLAWARDTAAALDVIHARGVIHLDLKPANLFLSNDGALKVLDFGISKRSGEKLPPAAARSASGAAGGMQGRKGAAGAPSTMGRFNPSVMTRGAGAAGGGAAGGSHAREGLMSRRGGAGGFFPSVGRGAALYTGTPTSGHAKSSDKPGATAAIQAEKHPSSPPPEPDAKRSIPPAASEAPGQGGDIETALFMAERDANAPEEAPGGASAQKSVAGTPGFMAPEILEFAEPTAATDAYSLAVCVVQLTTGRLPQDVAEQPDATTDSSPLMGWLSDVRVATLRGEMRDLSEDPAHLPRGLVHMLTRLLAIDPAQRGVTPGALRAIFDEVWERPYGIPDPPYAGLSPFTAEDEGTLFGRDEDVTRLGRELMYEPCVVLQGPRGTGKSSLARAGLVPDLARRGADDKDDWIAVDVHLGDDPDAALDSALASLASITGELSGAGPEALFAWCERSPIGVAIVVDPLDSIVDADAAKSERASSLFALIAESDKRPGLRLIGILGEERTSALIATDLGAKLRASLRYVTPPSASAMDDIAFAPAELAGAEITDRAIVLADVQQEMRAGENHLPFVAVALRAWWDRREAAAPHAGITLRGQGWRAMGGVPGALAAHADAVIASIPDTMRHVADELLLRLSTTSGQPLAWREADLTEVMGQGAAAAPAALGALAQAHLVRIQKGTVDIGHPCLLTSWPHLSAARLREMDRLVFLERLREASVAWSHADKPDDLLLQGPLLREAGERGAWLARGASALDRELVAKSARASRIRTAKKAAAAVLAVLTVVLGLVVQREYEARQAIADAARKAAEQRAITSDIVAKSRRTEDPFPRAAWIAEAMKRRSPDGSLPLDLASTVANIPSARFLTLDPIAGPTFPWDDRWLIGAGPGVSLTIVDMLPTDSDVIEDMGLDVDPDSDAFKSRVKRPKVIPLMPHDARVIERAPFAFDTSFATRSVSGEVRVWRLRENGTIALAAVAPLRCASSMLLAALAPVLACSTEEGIARWDLRRSAEGPAAVDRHAFVGTVLDISPDGARVAATVGRKVLLWEPHGEGGAARESVTQAPEPVLLARFSPRDRAVALIRTTSFEVVSEAAPDKPLIAGPSVPSPVAARWDKEGLDIAICNATGGGDWHYLRKGHRPKAPAPPADPPCAPPPPTPIARGRALAPPPPAILRSSDEPASIAGRDLGTHPIAGGFRLSNGRVLTRDLVLFSGGPPVGAMLRFRGLSPAGADDPLEGSESAANVVRVDKGRIAFQIGEEIRVYSVESGKRERARRGNIVRLCEDGRLLAFTRDSEVWRLFDALGDAPGDALPREPGLVLGADAACSTLLTQRLDGTIVAKKLGAGSSSPGLEIARPEGYVYAVAPSPARAPFGSGLWLAVSSGVIGRYDDRTGVIRALVRATPRATAIGDGPSPGEVAYADATGVLIRRLGGQVDRVLEGVSAASWEDLSVAPDGLTMLLCTGDRIAVLDVGKREITGEIAADGRSRFSTWDEAGSVLAWTFDRIGGPEGQIIPRGLPLAIRVAEAASNLRVENRRLVAKP